jgi:hypothetical protein
MSDAFSDDWGITIDVSDRVRVVGQSRYLFNVGRVVIRKRMNGKIFFGVAFDSSPTSDVF